MDDAQRNGRIPPRFVGMEPECGQFVQPETLLHTVRLYEPGLSGRSHQRFQYDSLQISIEEATHDPAISYLRPSMAWRCALRGLPPLVSLRHRHDVLGLPGRFRR